MLFPCQRKQKSGDHLEPLQGFYQNDTSKAGDDPSGTGRGSAPHTQTGCKLPQDVKAELRPRGPATFSRPLSSSPHELPSDVPVPGC